MIDDLPPIIVIGAGGHARVAIDCLQTIGRNILFCTDLKLEIHGQEILGVKVQGPDDLISKMDPKEIQLVNGMGSIHVPTLRKKVFQTWTKRGYEFACMIHPSATVARDVHIEPGVQIMAGAVVQSGVVIHENSIVNTGACIDHDCMIGPHCHVAPRVALSGSVVINESSHIGTAACIVQGITLGQQCVIGAGATVIRDLPAGTLAVGTPAKPIQSKSAPDS